MRDLSATWNAIYNGPLPLDPVLAYIAMSALRVLLAWAAWVMLLALLRYLRAAFPPPYTPDNLAYWLRWWLWLRLREYAVLKASVVLFSGAVLLQLLAGVGGDLAVVTPYLLLAHLALLLLLAALAHLFTDLTRRIQHPTE